MQIKKQKIGALVLTVAAASMALVVPALAANTPASAPQSGQMGGMFHRANMPGGMMGMKPAAVGTVTAINGSTLTVTAKNPQASASTVYTVDATNAKITDNGAAGTISSIAVGDNVFVMGTVNGTSITATSIFDGKMGMMGARKPGVSGTVASISGSTLTVTAKQWTPKTTANTTAAPTATTVTYTVDASNATVTKDGAASSVSGIAVGDTVMIEGTVSGASVTATAIRDGMGMKGGANSLSALPAGNGQPIVGGKVTAVSGDSVTITNTAGVTYTIDATNAKFTEAGVTNATIGNIAVGNTLLVQGTVNGTAVTASTIMVQGSGTANTSGSAAPQKSTGFFGAIGGFFSHLFGF